MGNRRHHTSPRFYLNRFLSPGWLYRRQAPRSRHVRSTKDVAVQIDYYGRPEDERKALDEINKAVENEVAPVLEKLIIDLRSLTSSDWILLAYLFANFAVRSPAVIDEMRATYLSLTKQVNEMARKVKEAYERAEKEGKDLSLFTEPIENGSPSYSLDEFNRWAAELETENGHLAVATDTFDLIKDVANYIQQMTYLILEAPAGLFFVTCDRPLSLISIRTGSTRGAGWGNADALASIPLSPKYLLMMFYYIPRAIRIEQISAEEVHLQNIDTMKFAKQEVYSPKEYNEAENWMFSTGRWSQKRKRTS